MTSVTFPFEDYYQPEFVDPMYAQYQNQQFQFNPWLMNQNEVRYNLGWRFKKKYSHYPCPMGFRNVDTDYCERYIQQVPQFYTDKHRVTDKDFLISDGEYKYAPVMSDIYPSY